MYCKRCGSKLEENMLGCPVCGQPVDEDIYTDFEETDGFELEEPKEQALGENLRYSSKHTARTKSEQINNFGEENTAEENLDITGRIPKIGNEKQTADTNSASEDNNAPKDSNIASRIPEIKDAEQIKAEQAELEQAAAEQARIEQDQIEQARLEQEQAQIEQTQELYLQAANMQVGNIDQTQKILRINDPRQQTLLGAHRGLFFTFIALVLIAILAVSAALYIYKDQVEQESIPYYTITYETNGGSRIPSQEVKEGTVVSAPPEPTISGRYFAGWYSDTSCQKQVKFPLTANENMTLYAKWMRDQKAAEQALNSTTTDNAEQENSSNTTSSNNATN